MKLSQSKDAVLVGSFLISLEIGTIAALWIGQVINEVKVAAAIATASAALVAIMIRMHRRWVFRAVNSRRWMAVRIALSTATCILLAGQAINKVWAIIACISYWVVIGTGKSLERWQSRATPKSNSLSYLGPLMLVTSFGLAVGHTVKDGTAGIAGSLIFVLSGAAGATIMGALPSGWKQIDDASRGKRENFQSVVLACCYILLVIACWRSDFLTWAEGSAFHWSYFAGPANEYQTNAWYLAANQYSPLITFLSSLISGNTWRGIYVVQASLYTAVVLGVASLTWGQAWMARIVGLSLCYLLLFADPGGVGPQAFPSSGLMRFFPIYIYSAAIASANKSDHNDIENANRNRDKIVRILQYLALFVGFSWSAESWLALSAGFAIVAVRYALDKLILQGPIFSAWSKRESTQLSTHRYILHVRQRNESLSFFPIILFWLLGFVAIGGTSAYPLSYMAKRYGWVEPQGWITLSVILCACSCLQVVLLDRGKVILRSTFLIAGVAMTTGYVSYRPVSNNITAILPALTILVVSFAYRNSQDYQSGKLYQRVSRIGIGFLMGSITSMVFLQILGLGALVESLRKSAKQPFDLSSAACTRGDESLARITSKLGIDINQIRQGTSKLSVLDSNGFNLNTGLCHSHNRRSYHPLVLQPPQLYLDPLSPALASARIRDLLEVRDVERLYLIVRDDVASRIMLPKVVSRIPHEWKLAKRSEHMINKEYYHVLTFTKKR